MTLRVVDLFCGGGGLSKGLKDAGLDVVAAFDNWVPALCFYRENMPDHPAIQCDVSDLETIVPMVGKYSPDIIAGGPPCQDFSSAGKRNEGKRANLTVTFAQIVQQIKPAYFIMENVERAKRASAFAEAISIFKACGYGISQAVLNASLCGVPQNRKRMIVFGEMGGRDNALTGVYRRHQSQKPMTIRDYFGDSLGIEYYYRHPRSYARRAVFSIDEPSPTVRGVNRPVPDGYPGHPGDPVPVTSDLRPLTTRERSMIQTFPKDWKLNGTKSALEQVVGNAVPCQLAKFVGECVLEYLQNRTFYESERNVPVQLTLFEQRPVYEV